MSSHEKPTNASAVSGGVLPMWVIYADPSDFPGKFVARKWEIARGSAMPTAEHFVCNDLDAARRRVPRSCGIRLSRQPGDDPVIVETWI